MHYLLVIYSSLKYSLYRTFTFIIIITMHTWLIHLHHIHYSYTHTLLHRSKSVTLPVFGNTDVVPSRNIKQRFSTIPTTAEPALWLQIWQYNTAIYLYLLIVICSPVLLCIRFLLSCLACSTPLKYKLRFPLFRPFLLVHSPGNGL